MSNKSLLKKIDELSFSKIESIRNSPISIWYDNAIDGLDQKSKQIFGVFTHTLIATSPLFVASLFLWFSLFLEAKLKAKKNQISSLENIVQMETQLKNALIPIPNESSVSDPSKLKSAIKSKTSGNKDFFKNVVINSVDIESGKGSISFLQGKLSFNNIGISELKNLINALQNKMTASIYEISIAVDKSANLLRGSFEIEMRVK